MMEAIERYPVSFLLPDGRTVLIRPYQSSDPIPELTHLLHRAYKVLADMGQRYLATFQDDAETVKRITGGHSLIGTLDGAIVATITLYPPESTEGGPWYNRPDVACFGQFAVEPAIQGTGLGNHLMQLIEENARELGVAELALDTSENATHLIEYYGKRGYRYIEHVQWPAANYRSVVMSKNLG